MNADNAKTFGRRDVLKGGGVLIVRFALGGVWGAGSTGRVSTGRVELGPYGPAEDQVDSWIAIAADGRVTLFSGCSELGTGSSTGLLQIVAEELDVPFERVKLMLPDTNRTPDQFVTSGSRTISIHSRPIRQAAAEARAALVDLAAKRLKVTPEQIITRDGVAIVRGVPNKKVTYAGLIGGREFNVKITGKAKPKSQKDYTIVGISVKRWDIPEKVFGTFAYVQDVTVPGMLHGRVVRPPSHGARVLSIDEQSVANIPGLVKVVRVADLVGVVCQREEHAIAAAKALDVKWSDWAELPEMKDLHRTIRGLPEFTSGYPKEAPGGVLAKTGDVETGLAQAAKVVRATYLSPFNHHGSIGPSCAIADVRADGVTLWCGTQTPYGTREAVAKFLGLTNDKVHLIFAEAAGCYGQNGADDVAIDALVLSRAVGKPVRVQWSRADENGWETYKAARISECQGGLDANGKIVAWDARTFGMSGYSRPGYHEPKHGGEPGSLVTAQLAGWDKPGLEEGFSGAAGNFNPVYQDIPNRRVVFTYLGSASHRQGPLRIRVGSMRGVGSPDNIFVAECFMDELAAAAGMDAIEFRLRHLPFDRGVTVLKAAAERAKWQTRPSHSQPASGDMAFGRGVAVVGTNTETSVAGIFEVAVNRKTGVVQVQRVVIGHDCGLVVNPGAVRNQIEGGVIQSISRALKEEVTFNRSRVTSLDWASYPIITFAEIPDEIDIVLIDRPDLPPMRVGEPASETVWPGVANAIYDAIGMRLRRLPFTPDRVLAELTRS
ncbi:MAG TPA: molybdopterin cofactor-binding domain-containing protein [Terriglobia bacterium]|nr:molybdopterin cofactor-binding domain-containing protein [Terriglobia bacterium]